MEVNLYIHKQIVKSVREEVTLAEFYHILNTYKPNEFYNTMYSEKTPCYYITEYLNANTVMYYANGWADKTPQKITIEKLYQSWRIEGLQYTKFYTNKNHEDNKHPSYCCQKCGECIGWLGRFIEWIYCGLIKHDCKKK